MQSRQHEYEHHNIKASIRDGIGSAVIAEVAHESEAASGVVLRVSLEGERAMLLT